MISGSPNPVKSEMHAFPMVTSPRQTKRRAGPLARSADNSGFLKTSRMPAAPNPRDSTSPQWPVIRMIAVCHQEEQCSSRRALSRRLVCLSLGLRTHLARSSRACSDGTPALLTRQPMISW
jgi:hypothetical protein